MVWPTRKIGSHPKKKPWVVLPGTKNHGISTTSTGISARKTKEFNQGNVVKPTNPHCDVDQGWDHCLEMKLIGPTIDPIWRLLFSTLLKYNNCLLQDGSWQFFWTKTKKKRRASKKMVGPWDPKLTHAVVIPWDPDVDVRSCYRPWRLWRCLANTACSAEITRNNSVTIHRCF